MEQTNKLKPLLDAYLTVFNSVERATDAKEVDSIKLAGVKAFQELERQVNRAKNEFPRLCREKRGHLMLSHYHEITYGKSASNSVTRFEKLIDEVKTHEDKEVKKERKAKKAKKAKK